jgi:hypothetical protein
MTNNRYGKIHTDGSRSGGQPLNDSIEAKALALVNEVNVERVGWRYAPYSKFDRDFDHTSEALCRAIEQHEAFRQEVSDIVEAYVNRGTTDDWVNLKSLIITEPDPLVEAMVEAGLMPLVSDLRAALEARGLEIREKSEHD